MKATIRITRTIEIEEAYSVEIDFQEMLDDLGLTRFEYNDDPEGSVEEYCENTLEQLIDEAGGLASREEAVKGTEGDDDVVEFLEAFKD